MSKPRLKTTTLTVRIEPGTKFALSAAAKSERRSLANMLEVMVLAWCEEHEVDAQPDEKKNPK
jgi:hypothetical protein